MATPIATNHSTVLQAIVDRLVDQIPDLGFTTSTCFATLTPVVSDLPSSGNLFCTVAAMDSQFDEGALTGGAENVCIEQAGVIITPHTAIKLDRVERADRILRDTTRGLLVVKQRILKALTGHRLSAGGNELLVNLIHPLNASRPEYDVANGIARLSVTFSTDFLWDLS